VKGGDDLKQEDLASKLMYKCNEIFLKYNLKILLRPMNIFLNSHNSGFIEFLSNTVSIDYLKSKFQVEGMTMNIKEIYKHLFKDKFLDAQ